MGRTERRHRHRDPLGSGPLAAARRHHRHRRPGDRVAGLLVLLYAQTAATISELTVDDVQMTDQQVRLRLGREPIRIPAPLDNLLRELVTTGFGHAAVGSHCGSRWLFPGGRPGQPLSAFRIAERLRHLGTGTTRRRAAHRQRRITTPTCSPQMPANIGTKSVFELDSECHRRSCLTAHSLDLCNGRSQRG